MLPRWRIKVPGPAVDNDHGRATEKTAGRRCSGIACDKGDDVDAARLLLEKGAEVDEATGRDDCTTHGCDGELWPRNTARRWSGCAKIELCQRVHEFSCRLCVCHNGRRVAHICCWTTMAEDDRRGRTVRHRCTSPVMKGHVDVARLVLENGAAVDPSDEETRMDAAIGARQQGNVDAARHLDAGQRRGGRPGDGGRFDAAVLRLLLRATPTRRGCCWTTAQTFDRAKEVGETPLYARLLDHVDVARLLLDKGAAARPGEGGDGATPLYAACRGRRRHLGAAAAGQRRGGRPGRGFTALRVPPARTHVDAARVCWSEARRSILKDRLYALYTACATGHVDAARLLLDKGAEVDRAKEDGRTPLYVACQKGHVDAARLLLDMRRSTGREQLDAAAVFLLFWRRRRGAAVDGERRGSRP